jgi:hypothetical protein
MAGNALRLVISISAPADSARWVVQHLLICALWSYHGFILEVIGDPSASSKRVQGGEPFF